MVALIQRSLRKQPERLAVGSVLIVRIGAFFLPSVGENISKNEGRDDSVKILSENH